MTDDTILPFSFPAVHTKKVTAAFDGGRLTSNGGVMLLAMAERRLGLADPSVPGSARSAGRAQPCRYVPRSHVRDLLRLRGRQRPRSPAVRSGNEEERLVNAVRAIARRKVTPGPPPPAPAWQPAALPEIDTGPGLDKVAPDGVSTQTVRVVPCSTAARETADTTTCTGIPEGSTGAKRR